MPQAHVAAQMGLSRATVAKWWNRWQADGHAGLVDRSSRPHRSPRRTGAEVEARVCRLRRSARLGPARLAARTGVPASTVHKILVRHGLNRLSWIDRPTGRTIRRYERPEPGDLVHLDVKKGRQGPARGRVEGPRQGPYPVSRYQATTQGRLQLPPRRHRRPQPPGLRRGARQRDRRHPRRVLRPGKAVVPKHRRRHRRDHHRQRAQLPIQKVRRPARRPRHRPHLHPPVPAPDQRQSRAVQPHPRRRIPLQLQIQIRTRPPTPTRPLDPRLQSPPPPHRHRRHTLIMSTQPLWALHLASRGYPGTMFKLWGLAQERGSCPECGGGTVAGRPGFWIDRKCCPYCRADLTLAVESWIAMEPHGAARDRRQRMYDEILARLRSETGSPP